MHNAPAQACALLPGRGLARTEIQVAVSALLRHFPGRWRVPGRFVQEVGGQLCLVRQRLCGGSGLADVVFAAPVDGVLAVFAGRRPLVSLVVSDFEFVFATADARAGLGAASGIS
ncbi:MAG TPA: hypothetical protein VGS19_20445 [Streptosporangiaceae bacterium]|nr:hypothetical protein [Streptosporangiaceae bacterium]